jgi:hypothetical protein
MKTPALEILQINREVIVIQILEPEKNEAPDFPLAPTMIH